MDTITGEDMYIVENRERCDEAVKRLLANKMILAYIMRYCVEEYRDCDINEIAEKYIEGEPEIGSAPMRPDLSGKIRGSANEDSSIYEGTVYYDIKFMARARQGDDEIGLIINVEAQQKYNTGYPLIKRGIYYCSRMISSQYGTEFEHSEYGRIKKVYSIWICMNAPRERRDTITEYGLCERNVVGEVHERVENYDLMKVVMVCLGDDGADNRLLRLLNLLFVGKNSVSEKKQIMSEDFGIPMTNELSKEVNSMCNFSQGFIERGREEGIEIGVEKGIGIGRKEGIGIGVEIGRKEEREQNHIASLKAVMESLNVDFTKAADILKIPEAEREKYHACITNDNKPDDIDG